MYENKLNRPLNSYSEEQPCEVERQKEVSNEFLRIKIVQFIATSMPLLEDWSSKVGTPSELKPIKNLLKLVESYARFFDAKPNSRLLLGAVQNFLIKWGKLEQKQIRHFSTLLNWFSEGQLENDKVKSFSQQVFLISDNEIENDKEFAKNVKSAIKNCILEINDECEARVLTKIRNDDNNMIKFWLKFHHDDYKQSYILTR